MTEVQGAASLDVNQVVQGLRQLKTGLDQLTSGMIRLNTESDKTKRTLKDTFKDAGQAAGKAGGPLGSWSSKLFGGATMDGAFSRVAVGLSLVTVGMRSYQAVVDAAIERTRLFVAAQKEVREVADQAANATDQMARRGEAQARSRTELVAVGGSAAAEDADMVASTGAATFDQAQQGVATIYGRFGRGVRARNAVDIAMRGAMGGLDFGEVAKELTRHGGAIDDPGMADRLLGRLAMRQTGGRGNPEEVWAERMRNINADAFLVEARAQASARSAVPGFERQAFMGANLGQKDAAFAANPQAFFENEAFKRFTQSVEDLKKMAEAQGTMGRVIADIFQPGGSFETQISRLQNARAESMGLGAPASPAPAATVVYPTGPYDPRAFGPFGR